DSEVTENATTEKELLVFYEEQDLYTATKRATPLRKAPAIATIVAADEIRNMGARNLLDVLKLVPGFGVSINEFGTFMIEVRGIRTSLSEKVLVMIDGHSLNRNIDGSAWVCNIADMLPVENIRQVEVVRGPGSALYGNSAFVATINVITRDAEEIDGLEVKGGGGSFDTYKGNLVGSTTIGDKLAVSASLDHYRTRGPKLTVEADALTGTPFSMAPGTPDLSLRQTDAFLKIGYGDLSFRGGYSTKKKGLFIGFADALTDNSYEDHEYYWGEVAYARHIANGLSSSLKLRYDYYGQDPNVKILPNGFPSPTGTFFDGMIGKPLVKDRTGGIELQVDWDAFKGNHLIAGASYEVMQQYDVKQLGNFDPSTLPLPTSIGPVQEIANWNKDVTRQTWAAYLQDEWQLLERMNLTAGVRYDHYSDFGGTFNPRVGLVWNFRENADLKFLYGQAFRAPNFVELYNINNPAQKGDTNLKPERISTYEAGLAYRLNRFFAGELNYFYSTIDDLIDLGTPLPHTYANIGKSRTQGVEIGLNGAFDGDLYWRLTYAFQDQRDAITGRRLAGVPSQRATGSANYALTQYLNLHSDLLWTGPRPRSKGGSRPDAPSYTTVDLAVTLKNFFKTLEIQAAVHNLFDERFRDPDISGAIPGDFPREGISAFVTASYKF
ncbi:MAG TPA: TonB-dependent receptor, partial [Geobacteraceae bacterium]|nr:TonB-dependent receptor [Geobacteraceae bacterium]